MPEPDEAEALARAETAEWMRTHLFWGLDPSRAPDAADSIFALPAVRGLLADRDTLARVAALAEELDWLVQDETVDETARVAHAWTRSRLRHILGGAS